MGIGFAMPINTIRDLLPQLRNGKVTRGVIGVGVSRDPVTTEVASALGLPSAAGALLTTVNPGGPADKAGLQRGDVIIEFNGRPVADNDGLVELVVSTKPETTVPVTVIRNKQRRTVNVTVGELDLDAEQRGPLARGDSPQAPAETGFGMEVGPITPELARELQLPAKTGGAVVAGVDRNSPASNAGIRPNDVIIEVNQQPVSSVSQVQRELQRAAPGQPVFLVISRDISGDRQEIFITMTKR
jgi:serine protease Do